LDFMSAGLSGASFGGFGLLPCSGGRSRRDVERPKSAQFIVLGEQSAELPAHGAVDLCQFWLQVGFLTGAPAAWRRGR
jgi:hypothetical protein